MDKRHTTRHLSIRLWVGLLLILGTAFTNSYGAGIAQQEREQALRAIQVQDYDAALSILDARLQAHPLDLDARYIRGTLRLQLKHPQLALDDLEQARRQGGRWPHLRHKIALARLQLGKQAFVDGQNPKALVLLQLALADIPDEFRPLTAYWLTLALLRGQDRQQAEQLLTTTLTQYPDTELRPVLMRQLKKLQNRKKTRAWGMKLQFGVAYNETVDYYPDIYFSPYWPNDKDYRNQLDLETYWRFGNGEDSDTTLGYRVFAGDYIKLKDYNTLQQAFSVDHRIYNGNDNWGWNLQYIDADLGIDGKQNNELISLYQSKSPSVRRMSLKKLTLYHNEYSDPLYSSYSGDGADGLYRYYFLKSGRNDRTYVGAHIGYFEAIDPNYTNVVYALDLGFERSFHRLDYGFLMSAESHEFINRPNYKYDEQQVHKLYLAYNFLDNLAMEVGVLHNEADSSSLMGQHSGRAISYLVTRWQP